MKRKVVLALIAALTLTVGSMGTVFAMNSSRNLEIQTYESTGNHTHTWGESVYVVDQEAVEPDKVWVVDKEAVYEQIKVVDKPAEYEQVKVVDQEAWDEDVTEIHTVCYSCGLDFDAAGMTNAEVLAHAKQHMLNGESGQYGSRPVVVDTIHHDEVFHYEDGDLVSPEQYHYENGALISPEEGHWDEVPGTGSPELGHWEHTCTECGEVQNRDTGEIIKPGIVVPDEPENPDTETPENPDTETPENPDTETPENPDTETPENPDTETPENPDTETPENPDTETPENPDTETPENPDTETPENPDAETPENPDTETPENPDTETPENPDTETPEKDPQTSGQNTAEKAQNQENSNKETQTANSSAKEDTVSMQKAENKAPKTGDASSLIYLATLAGSAVTGGTAFGLRKKFKK